MPMNPRLMRPLAGVPSGTPASLLLRFDGTNGSTSFVDSSANALTVTANGDAQISTAQSKWGGASGLFDGDGDYLRVNHTFDWDGDFTLEMWIYRNSMGGYYPTIFEAGDISGSAFGLHLHISTDMIACGDAQSVTMMGPTINDGQWYHIALVRDGGVNKMFVDGVLVASQTFNFLVANDVISIGSAPNYAMPFDGYIDDLRLVPLAVYTGPFIPPSAPLSPYATQVAVSRQASLLLHMDGSNGSTTFTDSSQNALTVTAYGDAEISTAESKFGGSSGYFDGDTAYLSTPATSAIDISSSDFTMECWVYPVSLGGNVPQVIFHNSEDDYKGLVIGAQMFGNAYSLDLLMGDTWAVQVPGDNALVNNQWQHIAAVRFGDEYRLFVNGVIVASATNSYDAPSFNEDATIGRFRSTQALAWDGHIDDFRIVRGLAVYQGPFVPPTGPLTAIATPQPIQAQASLLLHFDGANGSTTFTDSSQNALTVTANGGAEISTAESKWGGSSLYLDGSSSLDIADSSAFNFGTGDFTIEFWLHMDQTQSSNQYVYDLGANNAPVAVQSMYGGLAAFDWGIQYAIASVAVTDNTWAHFAIVRQGGTVTLYKDGVSAGSSADSQNYSSTTLRIGQYGGGNSEGLYGYIDDFRIVKGLAVYGANGNFTPPTGPLSATVTPQ